MDRKLAPMGWFIQTKSNHRRAPLLASLALLLIVLLIITLIIVLIDNQNNFDRASKYVSLISVLLVLIVVAYGLNRSGHYYWAAGLTVFSSILGPGGSLLLDPLNLGGDYVPLNFGLLTVLLASLLLPPIITLVVAVLQWTALILIADEIIESPFNWVSFLLFIVFSSVLSILANIQLARSEAELIERAIRDHLTNLYNRRYLDEFLKNELQRASREEYSVSVIMLDLDHFKQFNDSLGHAAGDAMLIALGKFLSSQVRKDDVVCRYGGEEFVLILPDVSFELAKERSEILRRKIPEVQVVFDNKTIDSGTVSIGIAEFNRHGTTGEELLKAADKALMVAKQTGRDRVVEAE